LQALDFLEGSLIVALGSGDAGLEAGKDSAFVVTECAAELEGVFVEAAFAGLDISGPELGFGAAEAAQGPFGVGEDVDEAALFGGIGVEAVDVVGDERIEIGRVFVVDDFGFGEDAGLGAIAAGNGFARGGAGAGGLSGIAAIRFDLEIG